MITHPVKRYAVSIYIFCLCLSNQLVLKRRLRHWTSSLQNSHYPESNQSQNAPKRCTSYNAFPRLS